MNLTDQELALRLEERRLSRVTLWRLRRKLYYLLGDELFERAFTDSPRNRGLRG